MRILFFFNFQTIEKKLQHYIIFNIIEKKENKKL